MKILIVGGGPNSGASCMRAEQLGTAIGARVWTDPYHDPPDEYLRRAHFVIIVKRLKKRWKKWVARLNAERKPIVWDAVDFWEQPEENNITHVLAIRSFHKRKGEVGALTAIGATEQMAADCHCDALPHHHRIGLTLGDVRRTVTRVGYEGDPRYLAQWHDVLDYECGRRGWRFIVNPPSLTDVDLVVAFRGGIWDGRICRRWKSGVKYANSIAAGRPILTQPTAAFAEIQPPGTALDNVDQLGDALDHWADYGRRLDAAHTCSQHVSRYAIDTIAARYAALLRDRMGNFI